MIAVGDALKPSCDCIYGRPDVLDGLALGVQELHTDKAMLEVLGLALRVWEPVHHDFPKRRRTTLVPSRVIW